jgi:hypothetical protein
MTKAAQNNSKYLTFVGEDDSNNSVYQADFFGMNFNVIFDDQAGTFEVVAFDDNGDDIKITQPLVDHFVEFYKINEEMAARVEAYEEQQEEQALARALEIEEWENGRLMRLM